MIWIWIAFVCFVLAMLALDLGVFHRHAHRVSMKEVLAWSVVLVVLVLSFSVFVYFGYEYHWMGMGLSPDSVDGQVNDGTSATVKYLTGYVLEKSLSVDNIFVIAMLFGFFAVPPIYQHRVLFWGVLGALVLRGVMIVVGAALIAEFHWILYVFGTFLIVTALKMMVMKTDHTDPNQNIVVRIARRLFPVTARYHGEHFFVWAGSSSSQESEFPGAEVNPCQVGLSSWRLPSRTMGSQSDHQQPENVSHYQTRQTYLPITPFRANGSCRICRKSSFASSWLRMPSGLQV